MSYHPPKVNWTGTLSLLALLISRAPSSILGYDSEDPLGPIEDKSVQLEAINFYNGAIRQTITLGDVTFASFRDRFEVWESSNPAQTKVLLRYPLDATVDQMLLDDNHIYIRLVNGHLRIVDVSKPHEPKFSYWGDVNIGPAFRKKGTFLASVDVTENWWGLVSLECDVVNVLDPANPIALTFGASDELLARLYWSYAKENDDPLPIGFCANGNRIWLFYPFTRGGSVVEVYALAEKSGRLEYALRSRFHFSDNSHLRLDSSRLILSTGGNPVEIGRLFNTFGVRGPLEYELGQLGDDSEQFAFLGCEIINASDCTWYFSDTHSKAVSVEKEPLAGAIEAEFNGIPRSLHGNIPGASSVSPPYPVLNHVTGMAAKDDMLYVMDQEVYAVKFREDRKLEIVGRLSRKAYGWQIAVGDYLLVDDGSEVAVIDAANPDQMPLLGRIPRDGSIAQLLAIGSRCIILDSGGDLSVWSLRDSRQPSLEGRCEDQSLTMILVDERNIYGIGEQLMVFPLAEIRDVMVPHKHDLDIDMPLVAFGDGYLLGCAYEGFEGAAWNFQNPSKAQQILDFLPIGGAFDQVISAYASPPYIINVTNSHISTGDTMFLEAVKFTPPTEFGKAQNLYVGQDSKGGFRGYRVFGQMARSGAWLFVAGGESGIFSFPLE